MANVASERIGCMRWESTDGKRLDLRIAGYQFPDLLGHDADETAWDDANWLIVAGRVLVDVGYGWSFAEPCMSAFEALRLGVWLQQATDGGHPVPLGFLEPCLAFSLIDSSTVAVRFSHEAAPSRRVDEPVDVEFSLGAGWLARAADEWLAEVRLFPPR